MTTDPIVAPATTATNGKIAFRSTRNGGNDIYTMNADGTGQARVTDDDWADSHPAWSPDGTRIAYVSSREYEDYSGSDIFLMNPDGSQQVQLTADEWSDVHPDWSPDGTKIAYESSHGDTYNPEILVMNADATDQHRLVDGSDPDWSPDGTKIAYRCCTELEYQGIYIVGSAGGSPIRVTDPYDETNPWRPDWSPDGSRLVYEGADPSDGDSEIFVINADGSGQTQLTNTGWESDDYEPVWSPDGTKIAFVSTRNVQGISDIYVMNADGSGLTRLTTAAGHDDYPSWQSVPPAATATLTVSKQVINDDGGDLVAEDFTLYVDGQVVHSGETVTVTANTPHTVSEMTQAGYTSPVFGGACNSNGVVTLGPGTQAECTLSNDDIAPRLKLVKRFTNPLISHADENNWTLSATAAAPNAGRNFANLGGEASAHWQDVYANVPYALSESNVDGYRLEKLMCNGQVVVGNTVTLAPGESVKCRFYNSETFEASACVLGWGLNDASQASRPEGLNFVAIAAGGRHSLALRVDGSIVGWGDNTYGQRTPPATDGYVAIAAGANHSLALREDGSIVGWGRDNYGQASPPAGTQFVAIAAGGNFSLALRSDGSIAAWGDNTYGQRTPPAGNDFAAISAGANHGLALSDDGSIVGWGRNNYGQRTPPAGTGYVAIAAGGNHSLALRPNGSISGWGDNTYLQRTPPAGTGYVAIAAGGNHSLGLTVDNLIASWGRNNYRQRIPPAGSTYLAIAAGGNHSLALSWSCYQPDALIRKGSGAFIGNDIYNDDAADQTKEGAKAPGLTVKFGIQIQNDGGVDSFTVKATGTATTMYTVTYWQGTVDVTAAVVAGTYTTGDLGPGEKALITAKVKVKSGAAAGSTVTRLVTVTSETSPATVDAVKFVARRL